MRAFPPVATTELQTLPTLLSSHHTSIRLNRIQAAASTEHCKFVPSIAKLKAARVAFVNSAKDHSDQLIAYIE